ncbi:MAG: hypothetical protein MRERV_24c011 [Mycoplasmataceae bacterium RV_VA103A]|nr:MAG: hypothetical protein MRERV_24c011 [Mycoplasmataceae bacterium RV_VA103A]
MIGVGIFYFSWKDNKKASNNNKERKRGRRACLFCLS